MRRLILIAALPLLIGGQARESAPVHPCGAICDELAGAWSVTVAPTRSVMSSCTDPGADRTLVTFPSEAIGLGEVKIVSSSSGTSVEFRSEGPPIRIAGILDGSTLAVRFDLHDGRGKEIACSGVLRKFTNPGGSSGWAAATACESGKVGAAACRLDPPVKVALLVQRILMEGAPSRNAPGITPPTSPRS
jgi:hypothetical protein